MALPLELPAGDIRPIDLFIVAFGILCQSFLGFLHERVDGLLVVAEVEEHRDGRLLALRREHGEGELAAGDFQEVVQRNTELLFDLAGDQFEGLGDFTLEWLEHRILREASKRSFEPATFQFIDVGNRDVDRHIRR